MPILVRELKGKGVMRKEFERVYVTSHERVAVLTLNHPEVMNAASLTLVQGAANALSYIEEKDSGFRALIITGEGKGFCSGANLSERGGATSGVGHALETFYHPFLRRLRDCRMPIITAVNGAAAGVGMSLALMGDIVIAGTSAYFLQAFPRLALVPAAGSNWAM